MDVGIAGRRLRGVAQSHLRRQPRRACPFRTRRPKATRAATALSERRPRKGKPRLENCILVFDANGKLLEDWTQWDHLFAGGRGPHHVKISPYDPEKHVWVIDDMVQQVFEFTHDGKQLVMTLGERLVQGQDDKHFGRPTDIAWLPDGTFFISDGYVNTRVMKFDKNGKFLMAWGTKGNGPGPIRSAAFDRYRCEAARLRGGPLQQPHPDLRREREISRPSGTISARRITS